MHAVKVYFSSVFCNLVLLCVAGHGRAHCVADRVVWLGVSAMGVCIGSTGVRSVQNHSSSTRHVSMLQCRECKGHKL